MAVVNGKVQRARFTKLRLNEISSVDKPAQPGALASIVKRASTARAASPSIMAVAVAKYVSDDAGAHTFNEVLQANLFDEKIWPMVSALSQSIRTTVGDKALAAADRESKITTSVEEFLAAVRDLDPAAEKRLASLISKGTTDMKTTEQLETEVAALKGQLADRDGELATAKAALTEAERKAKEAKEAEEKAAKALAEATDETIKVGDTEIRKSLVGDANFAVAKALADERDMARIEKRAETEFGAVVGTAVEKAAVLKARASMPEDAQKALDAILASAQKMASMGFAQLGQQGGVNSLDPNVAKAAADFDGKVTEIAKRDGIGRAEAMSKARREHADLFAAANASQGD